MRHERVDRPRDRRRMRSQAWPTRKWKHQDCDLPICEILLVAQILVRRYQHFKPLRFGNAKQLSIGQLCPAHLVNRLHLMSRQGSPQWERRALIEQDVHTGKGTLKRSPGCAP